MSDPKTVPVGQAASPTDEVIQAERQLWERPGRATDPFDKRLVVYGQVSGLSLPATLYRPRFPAAPRPAVVFVHGGGWWEGDRGQFARHAAYMATEPGGRFVALCITYRLSRQAAYPACVQDARCAVRWLRAHAGELGVDAGRIAIAGSSAGAHIAALAAVAPADLWPSSGGWDNQPADLQAAVLYNGIFRLPVDASDTLASQALVTLLSGTPTEQPDRYREASPLTHVGEGTPPALLLHGDADTVVSHRQSIELAEAIRAAGGTAEIHIVPGVAHGGLNEPGHFQTCLARMIAFLSQRLSARPSPAPRGPDVVARPSPAT